MQYGNIWNANPSKAHLECKHTQCVNLCYAQASNARALCGCPVPFAVLLVPHAVSGLVVADWLLHGRDLPHNRIYFRSMLLAMSWLLTSNSQRPNCCSGCCLILLALLLPHAVTICCLLSYAVVVAVFQLEPVPWLVDVALLFPRRDLLPRRKLLLDVVGNVRLVCFQWPAARVAVPAAVCACRSARRTDGVCCNNGGRAAAAFLRRALSNFFAVCCSQCLSYLLPMASG